MLIRHLVKKPLYTALYVVLLFAVPWASVSLTYKTAMLISCVQTLDAGQFSEYLLAVALFFILYTLLNYGMALVKKAMLSAARISLKNEMFGNLTMVGQGSFDNRSCGEYIATFSNDISLMEYQYFSAILDGIDGVISFAAYFGAILSLNRVFAIIVLICESSAFLICMILRKHNVRLNKDYIDKLGFFAQRVRESFGARLTIQNYHAVPDIEQMLDHTNRETERAKTCAEIAVAFTDSFAHFTRCLGAYSIVACGAMLMLGGTVSFSEIYVAYSFANTLSTPVKTIIYRINDICSVQAIKNKIAHMAAAMREESLHTTKCGAYDGIHIDDVSVTMGHSDILRHITFHFEPGKKYLITGCNGSGKTTLMRLLVRRNDSYSGSAMICGEEIKDLPYSEIRKHISYVSEDVSLLTDSVLNNITLYRDVPMEMVQEAANLVQLRVPLDRQLHDAGKNISSGERRRTEIARCLINRPDVLILDEAISTLDTTTAYEIEKSMLDLENKTVILVSHNFSGALLERYDNIILMENGSIAASGTHRELLSECAAYRELINLKCGDCAIMDEH